MKWYEPNKVISKQSIVIYQIFRNVPKYHQDTDMHFKTNLIDLVEM